MYFLAPGFFSAAGKQVDGNVHTIQESFYSGIMLVGEYFGGRHQASLETVVQCNKHAHQGHQCFAAAHITLQ